MRCVSGGEVEALLVPEIDFCVGAQERAGRGDEVGDIEELVRSVGVVVNDCFWLLLFLRGWVPGMPFYDCAGDDADFELGG